MDVFFVIDAKSGDNYIVLLFTAGAGKIQILKKHRQYLNELHIEELNLLFNSLNAKQVKKIFCEINQSVNDW